MKMACDEEKQGVLLIKLYTLNRSNKQKKNFNAVDFFAERIW